MRKSAPFHARLLDPLDLQEASHLAVQAGSHGVYVANHLATLVPDGDVVGLYGIEGLVGLCYFGRRGNLVVLQAKPLAGAALAHAIRGTSFAWRIVLGPPECVRLLAECEPVTPLVFRKQLYLQMAPEAHASALVRDDVRPALKADHRALMQASLQLNEVDLNVDPRKVHRGWLSDTVNRRIEDGTTLVIGPPGKPAVKLDLGSLGPAGLVVEGVYTVAHARGHGLAAALVATTAKLHIGKVPRVCLHVGEANLAAVRAYRKAGMVDDGSCALLLRP